jgi:hypothetical protein
MHLRLQRLEVDEKRDTPINPKFEAVAIARQCITGNLPVF